MFDDGLHISVCGDLGLIHCKGALQQWDDEQMQAGHQLLWRELRGALHQLQEVVDDLSASAGWHSKLDRSPNT